MNALFGTGGNSKRFYDEGFRHSEQAPKWIAENLLDAYEYEAGNGIMASLQSLQKIGEQAKFYGIKMSLHTPYYISLSSIEPQKRQNSIGYLVKSLEAAQALNADTIVIHAGSAAKISRQEAMVLATDTLSHTLETIGDTTIHLGLETMGKVNQLGTLDEVLTLCKISPFFYPVVDFGHLNARVGGNAFLTSDDYRRIFDTIAHELSAEKAQTLHCHFSKIQYTKAGEKKHLTFADEEFGPAYEPLLEAIVKEGLSPRILCESDGTMADDAFTMKKYYQQLRRKEE